MDWRDIGTETIKYGVTGFAGPASLQIRLDIRFAQRHAGRTAVHDAAQGWPVAFPERGHREQLADGVSGHE